MLWQHSIILTAKQFTWSSSAYSLVVKPGSQRLKTKLFRKTHLIICLFIFKIKKTKPRIIVRFFYLILFFFYKKSLTKNIYLMFMATTKKIYSIIKVTDRTTIVQIIIWFCKWYHDLMFFISLYKIVVSIYTKLSRYIKVYSIMLYQIQKKHESYKVCLVWLHWKLILWKRLIMNSLLQTLFCFIRNKSLNLIKSVLHIFN